MLFLMFAALIAVCWGIFGKPHLAAAAILMWGTGDAAAALVGIPFGKHKVRSKLTDGKKSWEGSTAMMIVSWLAGAGMLTLAQGIVLPRALPISFAAALLGTATELFSPSEYDTVTVPTVIGAALLLLIHLQGGVLILSSWPANHFGIYQFPSSVLRCPRFVPHRIWSTAMCRHIIIAGLSRILSTTMWKGQMNMS